MQRRPSDRIRRVLLALTVVALAREARAGEPLPTLDSGTPYEAARGALRTAGWRAHEVLKGERRCDRREQTCDAYLEAESCLPNGEGTCTMLWERGDSLIAVETKGIDDVVVDRVSCRSRC